ncbi:MAG: sigma-54 dependent transcriptional regulator [Acidobacteriota bacterium]
MIKSEEPCVKLIAIDDDPAALELIEESLSQDGVEILTETRAPEGLALVLHQAPEIVLLDLLMPGIQGLELLDRIVEACPATDVVLLTGKYSTDSAVEAIRKGASDYVTKPVSVDDLRKRIGVLINEARRRKRALQLDDEFLKTCRFEGMVGRSPLMIEMYRTIRRGSFTGATQDKTGMVEYASGGVLFLDEIGDMPLEAQAKLLRAVEIGEYQRVGSPAVRRADLRIVAATNRNLQELITSGEFREDLYYRLSMVEIRVPPLADRREDLSILEKYFVDKFAAEYGKPIRGITPRAQIILARYSWPGNVRELENVLGHACMLTDSRMIDVRDLPETLKAQQKPDSPSDRNLLSLSEVNRTHIYRVLEQVGGNKARAAKILGINRATLYRFLKDAGDSDDPSD